MEILAKSYAKVGFIVSNVKHHSGDQRDMRDIPYTYITVSGWRDSSYR